jgi:tetrahydromethanopterin S-methyltransferase subunit B
MADIPDFMREFDTDTDYGFTPVSQKPAEKTSPAIDPKVVENSNLEIAKVKADVIDIKSMMNEVMQIVAEKDSVNKEIQDADVSERFKEIEKIVLPFLYNLSKSKEPYIHWPNRGPIIKAQMDKILKLTRG